MVPSILTDDPPVITREADDIPTWPAEKDEPSYRLRVRSSEEMRSQYNPDPDLDSIFTERSSRQPTLRNAPSEIRIELRFPEYLRSLCLKDLELLVVPAAFYTPRHDAWDILIKGAALSNLQYVLAVNQYGPEFFGRSSIVDPAGIVTARASDREGLVYDIIDPDYQDELRARINTYENRRAELYDL